MQDVRFLRPDFGKLLKFGFEKSGDEYVYHTAVLDGQFELCVKVSAAGGLRDSLTELSTGDIYSLHLVEDACGEFVGKVRKAREEALGRIYSDCFYREVFSSAGAKAIIGFASDTFGDGLEFLWDKLPDAAVLRRKDTRKWYAVFMRIARRRLGLEGDGVTEIVDVRHNLTEDSSLLDGKRFLAGYHMNKKSWMTIILDGSVPEEELLSFIKSSYDSAR